METTVKIPVEGRQSIDAIRARIAKKGLDNVSAEFKSYLRTDTCPFCYTQMSKVTEAYAGVRELKSCPKCGFSKPVIDVGVSTTADDILKAIGVTTIVLLGIYALAKILEK